MSAPQSHAFANVTAAAAHCHLAVVVPVYRNRDTLDELCTRLVSTLETVTPSFAIVLVDDGSPDDAWSLIRDLGRRDARIQGVRLSRNFGQHYALTAGIDHARAEWYVVMDGDLQDAPEDIPQLYAKAQSGFPVVVAARDKSGHAPLKRAASRAFYALFNALAGLSLDSRIGNFRIFSDRVADGFRAMRDQLRFLPASFSFMGFETGVIVLPHHPRHSGKSSYTLRKLTSLAVHTILAHSQTPLRIATMFGFVLATMALLAGLAIAVRAYFFAIPVSGWASLIVSIFVVGGTQIFITGLVGVYVGRGFEESKRRPLYFVRETSNLPTPRHD